MINQHMAQLTFDYLAALQAHTTSLTKAAGSAEEQEAARQMHEVFGRIEYAIVSQIHDLERIKASG